MSQGAGFRPPWTDAHAQGRKLPGRRVQARTECGPCRCVKRRSFLGSRVRERAQRFDGVRFSARIFGPPIFDSRKLSVNFLDVGKDVHPADEETGPRTYTLTHSDLTSELTLAISTEFNRAQYNGWYSRIQRDEVLAIWKRTRDACSRTTMDLHVHCYVSGNHLLHRLIACVRFWIFRKELPVALEAFRHGDKALFQKHPELEHSSVWVHFHSNNEEYNRRECWGPLMHAAKVGSSAKSAFEGMIHDFEIAIEELHETWPGDRH